ncbi:Putative protein in type-1 retrotransposable element R1DM [Araneus ventricosus]|uniref:Reverse transcriptase domain-containing protein n=1 Tax=Araneus ventricosus TaxID=182803 RepID=A0A4Y2MNQ5_ARAVE|nr:Putative protein in type-1 retrotransposable element R1DM [Araneus ventricosus]
MDIIKDKKSEIKISQIVKENGEFTNSYRESIDYVLKQHFPQLVETEKYLENVEDVDTEDFTINEVESCFLSMNKNGAPGIDGWSLDFIREIFIANRQWFLKVLNFCLRMGYFPNVWKTAKVLLIPKGGKDVSQYESYRSICLLPIRGKVFEKLLTNRLVTYLEDNKLLSDHQYGFRKGRSTEDALMRIKLFIETAKESEMVSCMISLDIQNAFNSIRWNQIKLLIHRNRVPGKIERVIYSFLRDRHIMLLEGQKWKYNIGVPQGSSLSPILWLLLINEALDLRETENFLIQAYADDIIIMLMSTASYHFTGMGENILKHLEMWANTYNLTFSKNKTKYLMFKYRKDITHFPGIYLYGGRIGYDKNIKYLGIIFDTNLSFMSHLNAIQSKVMKLHEKIKRNTRALWGLKAEVVKQIYLTVLEKMIMYGSSVWYRNLVKINKKLIQIQRTPLIGITKIYRTVSNEALQVLAGCPPLDIKIAEEIEVLTRIKQVLTGHGVFGSFQASMFGKPAECQCGQNIESVSHVILECELWRDLRSEWPKSWKNKDLKELVPIHEFRSQGSAIVKALYETRSMDWS